MKEKETNHQKLKKHSSYMIQYTVKARYTDTRLRWLDTVFQGQYLPSLSIKYVAINKVLEKLPPRLY